MKWNNETELFEMMKEKLYAAVISDALDQVGYRNQTMHHDIRPLYMEAVAVGRAIPVLCVDVYEVPDQP